MNSNQLVQLKKAGEIIPKSELESFITAYVDESIGDDEMTPFLKAVHANGMTDEETIILTDIMLNSGDRIHFSGMDPYVADKHSTGGVGDKVSMVLGPIMAAAGLAIPMLTGRSLGHTGGTTDKFETIPGYQTSLTLEQFKANVETVGICIMGQTETICPADRKIYALRDVTETIDSIPLISGSIMSKKIAEGIQGLVLDIKTGNGAFMKTVDEALSLGRMLQMVGEAFGVKTDVVYSSMNQPLGRTAGLWCEMAESIDALQGDGEKDLMEVVFELGSKL
ncbi:MAG: thymidine phosphorylase, partial [Candidatus Marinimicrobia bacterium]|nr:thymidine phosphorylase [Candidatus Neomarinimicrobiota bacterium]